MFNAVSFKSSDILLNSKYLSKFANNYVKVLYLKKKLFYTFNRNYCIILLQVECCKILRLTNKSFKKNSNDHHLIRFWEVDEAKNFSAANLNGLAWKNDSCGSSWAQQRQSLKDSIHSTIIARSSSLQAKMISRKFHIENLLFIDTEFLRSSKRFKT